MFVYWPKDSPEKITLNNSFHSSAAPFSTFSSGDHDRLSFSMRPDRLSSLSGNEDKHIGIRKGKECVPLVAINVT